MTFGKVQTGMEIVDYGDPKQKIIDDLEEQIMEKRQLIANLEAQNMALRKRLEEIGKVIDELLECEADTLIALSKMRKVIGR